MSDPDLRASLLAELERLLASARMLSSGGVSLNASELNKHTVSVLLLLRHLASLRTHATQLKVPHPLGKQFWEVEELLGLDRGAVAAALRTGEGLEDVVGAAARALGVPHDPATWGDTLSDAYCMQPSVLLMLQEAARGKPELLLCGSLTRLSLLCKYLRAQPWPMHYSMVLAATHAPPPHRAGRAGWQPIP